MAVNVGFRIPGIQTQLKSLAKLPDQLPLLSSKEREADGMMGLVRRNLVMGKGSALMGIASPADTSLRRIPFSLARQ